MKMGRKVAVVFLMLLALALGIAAWATTDDTMILCRCECIDGQPVRCCVEITDDEVIPLGCSGGCRNPGCKVRPPR
jgi:hypothetical protein